MAGQTRRAECSQRSTTQADEGATDRGETNSAPKNGVHLLSCPACDHPTEHRFLYWKNDCEIFRCEACGLGRAEAKRFDPAEYYTSDYFSGKRPDGYADYLGAEPVLRREFAQTISFIRKFRSSGRLLEVGCAYGFLLGEAKGHFDVVGIELAEPAAEHCRRSGLQVLTGSADDKLLRDLGLFDVIVMLDVIEHLPSPKDTISLLARHLNPKGIIVITTGDFGALSARLAGSRWRLMTPPQHLWFFSLESMRRLATSIGLKVRYAGHPWKTVPLSLIGFQLARMIGFKLPQSAPLGKLGIPLNLFDAMRVVLRKEAP
jgi:SAM-dependent methyltransferase